MANELSVTAAFAFSKNGIQLFPRAVTALQVTVNNNGGIYNPGFATSTVDTAIPLGGLTAIRWVWFHNIDPTNNITIRAAISGQRMWTLLPGEVAEGPLDPSITLPSCLSNNSTPLLEYCLLPS